MVGRLTNDPEVKYTSENMCIVNLSVAVDHGKKNGEKVASFFNAKAFGKTAELIQQHFHKGDGIGILTEPRQETWDDRTTGQKRSKVVFLVNKLTFLPDKKSGNGQQQTPNKNQRPHETNQQQNSGYSQQQQQPNNSGYNQQTQDEMEEPPF